MASFHFGLFIAAIAGHWIAIMGGVVAVIIEVVQRAFLKRSIPNWVFVGVAVLCLMVAVFAAWDDQFNRAESLQAQLTARTAATGKSEYVGEGTAPPTQGNFKLGDRWKNAAPVAGGSEGWICVKPTKPEEGPCHWVEFGPISL